MEPRVGQLHDVTSAGGHHPLLVLLQFLQHVGDSLRSSIGDVPRLRRIHVQVEEVDFGDSALRRRAGSGPCRRVGPVVRLAGIARQQLEPAGCT